MVSKNLVLFSVLLFSLTFVYSETIGTQIGVQNAAPGLVQNFDDIVFYQGDNGTAFLDLDDYFVDYNGDDLSFTYSSLNNITISIDSENRVSFTFDSGFTGTQNLQFNASDGEFTTPSNIFTITIGLDNEPPQWNSPSIDRVTVYQNYFVTFSTLWTDNSNLEEYIFTLNQGGGWTNYTSTGFSGQANVSRQTVQMSASPGTTVFWGFYAFDDKGNMNVTNFLNFTIEEFEINEESFEDFYTSSSSGLGSQEISETSGGIVKKTFTVDTKSLRLTLRQGDTATRVIRVTNTEDSAQPFRAELKDINSMAILSETSFTLGPKETKDLLVEFLIPKKQMPDQYFGSLSIVSEETAIIPIVLDIKPFDSEISLEVNISDSNKFVRAGREVTARITLKSLLDVREGEAILVYALKDFTGTTLVSKNESFTFSTLFEEDRSLVVPDDMFEGEYIFYAIAFFNDRVDLDSDNFFVGLKIRIFYYLEQFFYLLLLALFILIILYLYYLYKRNKKKKKLLELYLLLNELRRLVKEGKTNEALDIYKRIKVTYNQKIEKDYLKDQEKLKEELDKFSKVLKETPIESLENKEVAPPEKEGKKETTPSSSNNGVAAQKILPPTNPTPKIETKAPTQKPAQEKTPVTALVKKETPEKKNETK